MANKNVIREDVVRIGFEVDQSPLRKLDQSIEDIQSSTRETAEAADKAAKDVSKIGSEATEAARAADKLKDNGFKDAEADAEGAAAAADKFKRKTREAGDETEGLGDSTSKGANKSREAVEGLSDSVGDLTSAFAGVAAAFAVAQIVQGVAEVEQAINRLEAQTGATSAEMEIYSDTVKSLYTSGNGESIGDVANAMALVNQQFKDLDASTMERITNDATVLADTFDADLNETLRGVNALMVNMGLSADEAFDYIAKGTQNGLDKSKELSDNLAEYSQLWAQAGFSAEEMFTILQNGLDSGAYNLDKVNDFVKEFGVSLADGRIGENIDKFSEQTQELFVQWQNGEASQKDIFNSIINDLSSMTSEQEALTVASTVWSALGEDNAMKVITSLNNVNTTYRDVKGTMEEINEVRYDDIGTSLDNLSRSAGMLVTETLSPALSGLNNMLADGLNWCTEFAQEHEEVATGITAAALAATALTVGIGGVVAAAKFVPPVIAKISASFAALNLSMGAVGIAITAISAGIGIAAAVMKSANEDVEDYEGTLEECRYEIEATEAAHKKAVQRYGENSDAAKALERDLETLNKQYERGGGYVTELQERVEDATTAFEEMSTAQDEAMESFDNSETQGLQAVSMLEALSGKAQLTNTDLDLMSEYANYLNDTFNCNIVVDYETGELTGFDPTVVAQQIIDSANDKRVQSAMEYLSGAEFTENYITAAKNVSDLEAAVAEAQKEYEELLSRNDYASGYAPTDSELVQAADELLNLKESLYEAEDAMDSANAELEEYGNIVDESGATTEHLRDALLDTAENGGEFISSIEDSADAVDEVDESMSAAQEAVSAYNDELYELAQAYDEALEAAQESVAGQYAVWEEVGDLAETSVADIQSALQSQSEYWSSYSDNLAILQEKAQGIEGLSEMIATMADGSEDSAAAIAALAGASDEDLTSVVSDWQSVKSEQDTAAQSIADTATQFSTKCAEMGTDMQNLVSEMDMSTEAQTNASNTVNSFIDTMISTINTRKSEVTSALDGLMSAANQYNINVSAPVEGNATGTTNSADTFIAGEEGAELIVGKKGSTVFPASETNKIINAVQDYAGYTPEATARAKAVHQVNTTTYAPQFVLNMNGASATNENKRKVKQWVKESLNEVFNNLASDNSPIMEV